MFVCIHGDTYESNTSLVNEEAYETNKKVYLREWGKIQIAKPVKMSKAKFTLKINKAKKLRYWYRPW